MASVSIGVFSALLSLALVVPFHGLSAAPQDAETSAPLDALHSWDSVLGMTENTASRSLEGILVYSKDGTALLYPAEDGISNSTDQLGIVIHAPTTHDLAPGADYIEYTHFSRDSLLIMIAENAGESASTLYEYGSDLALIQEQQIPFVPKHVSNLWNGYSRVYSTGRLALALADDHHVWMINKCPPPYYDPYGDPRTYTDNLTISDAAVIGNPIVVDGDFANGSMIVVPTDVGLMAFDIEVVQSELSGEVLDIRFGGLRWMIEYSLDGDEFTPVRGDHMITFWYPYMPTTEIGKEYVALATEDSRVVAYDRETGNISWSKHVSPASVDALEIKGLHPSPEYLLVTGTDGQEGCMIALDAGTGEIAWNGTASAVTDGRILGSPEYIPGQMCFVTYTDSDMIYAYDRLFGLRFVYDLSDVGLSCVPRYLGNIYLSDAYSGNYIGVVTSTPELQVYPFIDYSDDSDDGVPDESSWPPFLAVAIAALAVVPVALYLLFKRSDRERI
jgi:hypothetical protein